MDREEYIKKANSVHGHYKYDNLPSNVDLKSKIGVICPKHGLFLQKAGGHIYSKKGCRKCFYEKMSNKQRMSFVQFVSKANKIHNNKYRYVKDNIKNTLQKVEIICPKHEIFRQRIDQHLYRKAGCPKCYNDNRSSYLLVDQNDFISRCNEKHDHKYDYSLVNYSGYKNKIIIICPEHGEFEQIAGDHVIGSGCPKCYSNQYESELIGLFDNHGINYNYCDRNIITPYELDFYIPTKKLAIEFNGWFWHSYNHKESKKQIFKHQNKTITCENLGIRLVHINEHVWKQRKEIYLGIINNHLKHNNKIYARKCSIVQLNFKEYKEFMDKNHLHGCVSASIRIGLTHDNKLVSSMGFVKSPKNEYDYEIARFATIMGVTVVGGASKMFKEFIRLVGKAKVLTFADADISNGKVYSKLGFKCKGLTKPNYFYIKRNVVLSRMSCQKHRLHNLLDDFDPELTEYQNMFNNGYRRFWNSGNYKYVYES